VSKGPEAFRTISEAAAEVGVPQHVLRFWETKFSFIRPMKRAGGRRFYRPQDIAILALVRRLLYEDGYTIKGVQKVHREQGLKGLTAAQASAREPAEHDAAPAAQSAQLSPDARQRLTETLSALQSAKARLDKLVDAR
jgi:DNA-binding transcriptional MerR regulator